MVSERGRGREKKHPLIYMLTVARQRWNSFHSSYFFKLPSYLLTPHTPHPLLPHLPPPAAVMSISLGPYTPHTLPTDAVRAKIASFRQTSPLSNAEM